MNIQKIIVSAIVFAVMFSVILALGCAEEGDDGKDGAEGVEGAAGADGAAGSISPFTRTEWVDSITSDEWTAAVDAPITLTMGDDFTYTFTSSNSTVTASGNSLTLTAGEAYVLDILEPSANTVSHYLSTKPNTTGTVNMPGDFFQSIATRKVQTYDAEYKAPYFKAIEVVAGNTTGEKMVQIYFVAVLTGTYYVYCQQGGHETGGMYGTIEISGGEDNQLDLEVDPLFDTSLLNDAGSANFGTADWGNAHITVTMAESPYGYTIAAGPAASDYTPVDGTLDELTDMTTGTTIPGDNGYVIELINPAANDEAHYFTAPEWYKSVWTRKAEDSQGEIKVPYFTAVEVRNQTAQTSTALFVAPVFGGTGDGFTAYCTQPGHATLTGGMRTEFDY